MANVMTTYVKIVNLNEETFLKFSDLFKTENDNSSYVELVNHFNKLFDEKFSEPDNVMDRLPLNLVMMDTHLKLM
jgi:hypothetical protein